MDIPAPPVATGAVVALKQTEFAKSRLDTVADPLRRRLAWTMAVDTLTALAEAVDEVLVVSDQPALESRLARLGLRVSVLAEPGPVGMNGALGYGDQRLRGLGVTTVLACVGDLPALRAESVSRVLRASAPLPRAFVSDASGVGTTMLLANGRDLEPHFQGRSAAAHAQSGAVALTAELLGDWVADARRDVDTEVDLHDAVRLGLGRHTAALIAPGTTALADHDVVTVTDQPNTDGWVVITSHGRRAVLPAAALHDGLRTLHPGQRLHAAVAEGRLLSAWL